MVTKRKEALATFNLTTKTLCELCDGFWQRDFIMKAFYSLCWCFSFSFSLKGVLMPKQKGKHFCGSVWYSFSGSTSTGIFLTFFTFFNTISTNCCLWFERWGKMEWMKTLRSMKLQTMSGSFKLQKIIFLSEGFFFCCWWRIFHLMLLSASA